MQKATLDCSQPYFGQVPVIESTSRWQDEESAYLCLPPLEAGVSIHLSILEPRIVMSSNWQQDQHEQFL